MPTLSVADSRAPTSAEPANAPELPAPIRDCTGNWCEPFAWFDHDTRSWKTWQLCWMTGWETFSGTWPRAGIVLNGIAYQRKPSAPLTNGTGFGSLPTLRAQDARHATATDYELNRNRALDLVHVRLAREMLPTPRATDADKGGRGDLLTVLRGYETKHAGTLPTPTARDWRSGKASDATHSKNSRPLAEVVAKMSGNRSGRMNPRFREWMMRLPIGWTERKPPETP